MICEKFYFLSAENETNDKKNYGLVTHAYVHRLADEHLAGFAPAFPLSFHDRKFARKPPVPIASVVRGKAKKNKNIVIYD